MYLSLFKGRAIKLKDSSGYGETMERQTILKIVAITVCMASVLAAYAYYRLSNPRNSNLIWNDEFDGTTLNLGKWNYRGLGPRRDAINVEDAISVRDGSLFITTFREGNETFTGMIGTMGFFENVFGYYECRVRFQTQPGHWSAFWLQSQTYGHVPGDTNVSGAEIDIFEYRAIYPKKIQHALYWTGEDGSLDGAAQNLETLDEASGWHAVGLDWSPDEYVFYVDGVETWRTDEAVSGAPQYIILSIEVASWGGNIADATLPDSVEVDYIRVYSEKP